MRERRSRRLALLGCAVVAGCADPGEEVAVLSVPVIAEEQWRVGSVSGAEWEAFGRVTAIAMDSLGRIFVADEQGSVVRAYRSDGEYLGTVGREGDGPGEFSHPSAVTPAPGGSLWIRDSRRITQVMVDDPWAIDVQDTWPGPPYPSSSLPSRFDSQGRYYFPYSRSLQRSGDPPEHFYLIYDGGEIADTLFVPPLVTIRSTDPAWVRTSASGGRILRGLNHTPFAPTPSWDLLPDGNLVSSDGATAWLSITGLKGDTVGQVTVRQGDARRIPERERQDSLAALNARLDSVPVSLDQVLGMPASVRQRELPETLPEVLGLHVDTQGRIWVRRWPSKPRAMPTHFDVFSSDGKFVGAVALPVEVRPDVAPWIGTDRMVVVEADKAYWFDRIVLFTFTL